MTGRQIRFPVIGFGTWQLSDEEAKQAVGEALKIGYRLIDTAKIYGNEEAVGQAIRESGIPRQDIFVTTKLWNDDQGYDRALKACDKSLEALGLDYLDLYLIHWPASKKRHEAWRAFERLKENGIIKAAGVSNYTINHIEELMAGSQLKPDVNQVEFHPFIYKEQKALLDHCKQQGILVEAYSPLRRMQGGDGTVNEIAEKHSKNPAQILLRWAIQHGTVPLPRSKNPEHIRSNFDIFDFELDDGDMEQLASLSDGERVTWDPAGMGR
jgi:diketogulonate reductase-like aldo/keto reductase